MRYLALDVGDERIGVALSDELGRLARPLAIIARVAGPHSFQRIAALVAEHGVQHVVVGLPLLADGSEGQQARSTRAYLHGLTRYLDVPVTLWDERQSTQRARALLRDAAEAGDSASRRRHGPRKRARRADDDVAAAVILQEYLDAQSELRDRATDGAQSGGLNP